MVSQRLNGTRAPVGWTQSVGCQGVRTHTKCCGQLRIEHLLNHRMSEAIGVRVDESGYFCGNRLVEGIESSVGDCSATAASIDTVNSRPITAARRSTPRVVAGS